MYPFDGEPNTHTCTSCGSVYLATLHYCPSCPNVNLPAKKKKGKKGSELFIRMPKKGRG